MKKIEHHFISLPFSYWPCLRCLGQFLEDLKKGARDENSTRIYHFVELQQELCTSCVFSPQQKKESPFLFHQVKEQLFSIFNSLNNYILEGNSFFCLWSQTDLVGFKWLLTLISDLRIVNQDASLFCLDPNKKHANMNSRFSILRDCKKNFLLHPSLEKKLIIHDFFKKDPTFYIMPEIPHPTFQKFFAEKFFQSKYFKPRPKIKSELLRFSSQDPSFEQDFAKIYFGNYITGNFPKKHSLKFNFPYQIHVHYLTLNWAEKIFSFLEERRLPFQAIETMEEMSLNKNTLFIKEAGPQQIFALFPKNNEKILLNFYIINEKIYFEMDQEIYKIFLKEKAYFISQLFDPLFILNKNTSIKVPLPEYITQKKEAAEKLCTSKQSKFFQYRIMSDKYNLLKDELISLHPFYPPSILDTIHHIWGEPKRKMEQPLLF